MAECHSFPVDQRERLADADGVDGPVQFAERVADSGGDALSVSISVALALSLSLSISLAVIAARHRNNLALDEVQPLPVREGLDQTVKSATVR